VAARAGGRDPGEYRPASSFMSGQNRNLPTASARLASSARG
jgi:hypothetical protein